MRHGLLFTLKMWHTIRDWCTHNGSIQKFENAGLDSNIAHQVSVAYQWHTSGIRHYALPGSVNQTDWLWNWRKVIRRNTNSMRKGLQHLLFSLKTKHISETPCLLFNKNRKPKQKMLHHDWNHSYNYSISATEDKFQMNCGCHNHLVMYAETIKKIKTNSYYIY